MQLTMILEHISRKRNMEIKRYYNKLLNLQKQQKFKS